MSPAIGHLECSNRTRAQGMALIEALVASAVLGMGLTAAMRLSLHTLQTASETRQHSVALALALDAMDCHQAARTDCALESSHTLQGTTYSVQTRIQNRTGLALEDLMVHVQWTRGGRTLGKGAGQTSGPSPTPGGEISLHSSRDAVPAWLGVSLP